MYKCVIRTTTLNHFSYLTKNKSGARNLEISVFPVFTNGGEKRQIPDIRNQNRAPYEQNTPNWFYFLKEASRKNQLFPFFKLFLSSPYSSHV